MSYDGEPVLHDVSFTVRPGTVTVVMGPSGVGKTTLVRAILGLSAPDEGDVTIGGRSVVDASAKERQSLRAGLGVLLGGSTVHDGSIFGSLTAWENVRYPLEVRGYDEAVVVERAWQRMVEFGLTEHAHHRPDTLSGGLRRRLGLARAFVDDPTLLVLDDPGTALDLANRERITSSIRAAREHTDATVILTCHDITMTRELGDDLVVLLDGRVAAAGPVPELLEGVYTTEDYDARFSVRASFDADTRSSLARTRAEREYRTFSDRVSVGFLAIMGLLALAAVVAMAVITAQTVY